MQNQLINLFGETMIFLKFLTFLFTVLAIENTNSFYVYWIKKYALEGIPLNRAEKKEKLV